MSFKNFISLLVLSLFWNYGSFALEQQQNFIANAPCKSDGDGKHQLKVATSYRIAKIDSSKVSVYIGNAVATFPVTCGQAKTFVPFFIENSTEGLQPARPTIDAFGHQVLKTCGGWGADVTKDDFKKLMADNPDILNEIYQFLGKSIYKGKQQTLKDFSDSLADVWNNFNAFKHISCGMPENKIVTDSPNSQSEQMLKQNHQELGGLHFVGRYMQMNDEGYIGLDTSCEKNEVRFPIYTVAEEYVTPSGEIGTKCPGGYSYTMTAKDFLLYSTNAFKYNNDVDGCYYTMTDKTAGDYYVLFFPSEDGSSIATSYPVLDPDFSMHPKCKKE